MSLLAAVIWAVIPSTPVYAQDQPPQPSLGDVARQARKDKEKNKAQAKTVITDDTLPSSKGLGGLAASDLGSSQGSGDAGSAMARALDRVNEAEANLKKLDALDRATLAKAVLLDNDVDFPNRRNWEDRLFAAKEHYVSHGRELIGELKQMVADMRAQQASPGGQGKMSPDDPRAKEMIRKVQEIVQDAVRTESAYQAVVVEGWDLAKQAKH
jgi:hypothetical protein